MSRIYFSIPVVIRDRDTMVDTMVNSIIGLSRSSKAPFIFDHWKPGWVYDNQSIDKADIFIFTHPNNAFKFNVKTLPSGVYREFNKAKTLDKKMYLAYKTTDGCIRYYDITEANGIVSGIAGTTHSLATFLEKNIPQEQIFTNPCAEISLPEHSIDLRKKVQGTSYDRRLLL